MERIRNWPARVTDGAFVREMPSPRHQALVELYRQSPDLSLTLLKMFGVEVPKGVKARTDDSDLSTLKPVERRADLVLLAVRARRARLAIVLEVQLRRKERKRLAWAGYAVEGRVRHRCPVVVLVICPDTRVARWARRPIEIGPGNTFTPLVLGPEEIPRITTLESATENVELAVLSAVAHASQPFDEARPVVQVAFEACQSLPAGLRLVYFDLIGEALGPALKEALMAIHEGYKFKTDMVKQFAAWMAEGEAKGKVEGKVEGIARVLERQLTMRFGPLSSEVVERLHQAKVDELERWAERLLTADSVDAVMAD